MNKPQPFIGEPLDDWQTHRRAKNRSRGTIDSYLTVGATSCTWLTQHDPTTDHPAVPRHAMERCLAAIHERAAPATVPKLGRLQQDMGGISVWGHLRFGGSPDDPRRKPGWRSLP